MYRLKLDTFKSTDLYWSNKKDCYVEDGCGEQLYSDEETETMRLENNQTWEKMEPSEFDVHLKEI